MPAGTLVDARLGPFRVEHLLGDGAMSEVYAAVDERLRRRVALKVLRPHLARSAEVRQRFAREARLASQLDHRNIVAVYDADEADGLFYISMRLVDGHDLGRLIAAKGSLSMTRSTRFLTQAAAALDAAHATGLIHRDVKPANMLVARSERGSERLFLTDFGLTRMIGSDSRHTQTGQIVGSVHYMSPEQIEGREVTHLSDVYSLGCVLFECLTGSTPFERDSDLAVLWAHVNAQAPSVSGAASVPRSLDAVIERALAKSPEERYQSCGDLARGMKTSLRRRHLPTRRQRSTPGSYTRRVSPDDLVTRRGRGRVTGTLKSLVFTTAVLALLGGTAVGLARVTGVWSPTRQIDIGDRSRLGTDGDVAATEQSSGTSRAQGGRGSVRASSRRNDDGPGAGTRVAGGLGTGQVGPDTEIAPFAGSDIPERVTRTVTREYNATALDGYGQDCVRDNVGCVEFTVQRGESYLSISIDDSSGRAVRAIVKRDLDGDGTIDGEWVDLCNRSSKPIRVVAGALVRVLLQRGDCDGVESAPTTGTVTAIFSDRS